MGKRLTVAAVTLGLWCVGAHAQGWRLTPSVGLVESYTDNLKRTATDPREEYITQVQPGFELQKKTAQSSASLSYTADAVLYAREDQRNDIFHQLKADAARRLGSSGSLAAGMSYGQELVDPTNTAGGGFADSKDVSNVFKVFVTPAWTQSYGEVYTLAANASQRYVAYADDSLPDSRESEVALRFDAEPGGALAWGAAARRRHTDSEDADSSDLAEASLDLRLRLGGRLTATGTGGYEENDIPGALQGEQTGGEYWQAGLAWSGNRDELHFSRGERYFGATTDVGWSHFGPVDVSLSHTRSLTTTTELAFEQLAPDQPPILVSRGDVVVQDRTRLSLGAGRGKSRYSLAAQDSQTENQRTLVSDEALSVTLGWILRIDRRNTADATGTRSRERFTDGAREETVSTLTLGWRHALSERAEGTLRYERTEADDSDGVNEFTENLLEVGFRATF